MADKITNDITLLFKTKLDEKSKQEVGKNLKNLLKNAAIGFDEAETKRNLEPIVKMMKRLFDKAEIAFDADQLLAMPSRQALQKMAEMEAGQLQMAFDKALAKSGGIKVDFGDMDLSAMTEPLNRLTQELSEIGERVANTTKKSVREIENTLTSLAKTKKLDKTVGQIEKTLNAVNNPKHYTSQNSATEALKNARDAYIQSVENNNPWEEQYQHLLKFVSRYEAMTKKIKPLVDKDRPEFKQLYEILNPKAGAAKISLEHFVDLRSGNELTEYKNQPWAREKTLQNIERTLRNGITVKEGAGGGGDNPPSGDSTPPWEDDNKSNKKTPNTKVPVVEPPNVDAEKAIRIESEKKAQAEKVAAEAAKQRRVEEEKVVETVKKINIYRGVIPPEDEDSSLSRREILDKKDGAEWWATNKKAAQTYADMDKGGAILVGTVTPKNPLIIDAGGRNYNDFGNMPGIKNIADQLPQLAELIASKADITDIQKYINTRAKELGHNVVQFDNVNDVLNPSAFKELGSTFAILDDSILEVDGAFAQLKYDVKEALGDYSKKATADNIPDYYKAPEKELQTAKDVQVVSEASAAAAQEKLETAVKTTVELEKQKKLLLYRRVEGKLDSNRISSRSGDALYDKYGEPSIQSALEMGYGGFGDGLYASSLSGARSLADVGKEGETSFFEFDASDYKFYINETIEQAELVQEFLLSLQKFVGAGSILDESNLGHIEDLSEEELFTAASRLFGNFNMTREQFHAWLENAKNECQKIAELFARGEVPEDHHNFGTRFMKELGYEGIHNATGDKYLDGEEQGTVIFDPNVDKIKESLVVFKSIDEYLTHIGQTAPEVEQSINLETTAHKQNAATIVAERQAQEELNDAKTKTSEDKQHGTNFGTDDSSSAELEAAQKQIAEIQEQQSQKLEAKDAEIAQIRETSATQLEAVNSEKKTLQNDLDLARQQAQSAKDEADASQAREAAANQKLAEQEVFNQQLREQLAGVKTGGEEPGASVGEDDLKRILGEVTYSVKIARDDADKTANKIAIDEGALEQTLNRVFTNILKPHAEQTSIEPKNEPWALENTLSTTIKGVLDQIQINTAKIEQAPQTPPDDADSVLEQIGKNVSEINSKIVKGAKATTKDTIKSQKTSADRNAQILAERIETQKLALKKFKTELETSGRMTDEVSKKIRGLAISLGMVKDNKGLTRWGQKFQQQKLNVGIADIEGNEEKQFEKELQKEQETRLKSLNKLYQEYGVLVERAGAASGRFGEQLQEEVLAKENEIWALRDSLDAITPEMLIGFDEAFNRGRNIESIKQYEALAKKSDADEATRLKNISGLEKEIGKLRADVDVATNEDVRNALEEEIQLREKLIELQRQGLEMNAQDEAYYRQNASNRTKQAKDNAKQVAQDTKNAFKEQEKEEKRQAANKKKLAKRQAMTGKAGSAIGRAEGTWLEAEGLEQAKLPEDFKKQLSKYYDALDELRLKHHEINTSEIITDKQQNELIKQTAEVNKLTESIGPLVAQYERLSGKNTTVLGVSSLSDKSTLEEYEQELRRAVMTATNGKAQIKGFDYETKTLTYTLKTGKREFTEYTAEVRELDRQYTSTAGKTKKIETFLEATKRKIGEISSYVTGMGAINFVKNQLKQGIQYVKEIDDALTELKKVTNETEKTYDKFLKTASKTADKLGSTMQEVISSTADFARLGSILAQTNIRPII